MVSVPCEILSLHNFFSKCVTVRFEVPMQFIALKVKLSFNYLYSGLKKFVEFKVSKCFQ